MKSKTASSNSFSVSDLMGKARSGQFGDLRLLALSVTIIVLCAVAFIMQANEISEKTVAISTSEGTETPPADHQISGEAVEKTVSGVAEVRSGDAAAVPPPTPEEQQRKLKEMTEGMSPGEVIVF